MCDWYLQINVLDELSGWFSTQNRNAWFQPRHTCHGLNYPYGVTIDFASQRLYWAEYGSHKIQSSDLDGRNVQLVVQLPNLSYPWGIAAVNDRIYWGNGGDYKLQSATKDGQDVQTLYTEADGIRQIEVVPVLNQSKNRKNDCAGRNCTTIYVLAQTSYRCLL